MALDADELRDLYPAALILEDVATRRAAPVDAVDLAGLRELNARLRATAGDPEAAAAAHGEFHERLVEADGDSRLHAVLRSVRRELEPYESAALRRADPRRRPRPRPRGPPPPPRRPARGHPLRARARRPPDRRLPRAGPLGGRARRDRRRP